MPEINTDDMYKKIKKQNGEAVAKILRSEILLDIPNIAHVLEFAGNDSEQIKQLVPVIREIYKTQKTPEYQTNKNPLELLNDAGYDAFVVKTEKQKNSIAKYYRTNEKLCTFNDPHRHENYYIIHAIKRGADKIKPSNHPEREDEYGTSVISIQIAKTGGFISIKNRYNHTVNNPDATFNNNPDNIIRGLSYSLKKYFDVEFNTTENSLPDNFRMVNDQLVYFNYEVNNMYFGPDYYFSGSTITKLNKDYEIMLDYFILDTRTGKIRNQIENISDDTINVINEELKNKKIVVKTNPNNKHERMIYADSVHVLSVENGEVTELNLPNIKKIGSGFLHSNKKLRKFNAPNLESIGNQFLDTAELTELNLPNVKTIGFNFLYCNRTLKKFNAPNLETVNDDFLYFNKELTDLELPSLKTVFSNFLFNNEKLEKFYAPNLQKAMTGFLSNNKKLYDVVIGDNDIFDKRDKMKIAKNKIRHMFKQDIPNLVNKITSKQNQ